jgi:hypothetical protein
MSERNGRETNIKMKKYLLLTAMLVLAVFALSSCSDDEKTEGKTEELTGTTWKCIVDDDDWVGTITFTSVTSFSLTESEGGRTRTHSGTYDYVAPRIVLRMSDWTLTGTVTGNKMNLVDDDCDECVYPFVKQ